MPDNKENNPSSLGGPAAGTSTTSATSNSKPPKPTMGTKIQDMLYYSASDGLDDVVIGGCSTCGSVQHETVKCDRKDVQSEYMMSGALQTETDSSACASATDAPADKGGQAQAQSGMPLGQDAGRRRSV
ncbi:hypothetical protein INS49_000749 [Diaporthe citri]|uniref:uncharacterized protein n=1 Tax=Diaporthe citri TaxID=83186 RepID=UPI001C818963|nr:uncharacterized protein INS49_000749 [Diaporthe citri]KAG6366571.1 hypothetical protein INS49_000749 [Diaporthe citri]